MPNGEDINFYQTCDSAKSAKTAAKLIEASVISGDFDPAKFCEKAARKAAKAESIASRVPKGLPTLAEALDFYYEQFASRQAQSDSIRKRINKWKRRGVANKLVTDITKADIATVKRSLIDRSASTEHNEFTAVSMCYRILCSDHARSRWPDLPEKITNPVEAYRASVDPHAKTLVGIRKPRPSEARQVRLREDHEKALRDGLTEFDIEYAVAFDLALETGVRQGQLMQTRRSWIDLERRRITYPASYGGKRMTKNGTPHVVLLSETACKRIQELYERDQGPIVRGRRSPRLVDPDMLFSVSQAALDDRFRSLKKALSINDYTWHDLKHEAASRMLAAGWSVKEVMAQTGNTTLVSMARYLNVSMNERQRRMAEFDQQRTSTSSLLKKPA